MNQIKISQADLNVSVIAGNIVSNAVHATRHLFCPFCADCYFFEFTLKDHLKKEHFEMLQKHCENVTFSYEFNGNAESSKTKLTEQNFDKVCSFCGAVFLYIGLLPKHIINYHGSLSFQVWEQQQKQASKQISEGKESTDCYIDSDIKEPTIYYTKCSPGLSEIFDKISLGQTPLKGILKKSATKSAKIICSPSSTSIRRTKNATLVRCESVSSARRMLRFDVTDGSSNENNKENGISFGERKRPKSINNIIRRVLFGRCASHIRQKKSPRKEIITSTPINCLDEPDNMCVLTSHSRTNRKRMPKLSGQRNRPLFSLLETFQCAHCKQSWESNADLLTHLNQKHKNIRRWFQADYCCGMCSAKFFSNRLLVRHCHMHHTPVQRQNIHKIRA